MFFLLKYIYTSCPRALRYQYNIYPLIFCSFLYLIPSVEMLKIKSKKKKKLSLTCDFDFILNTSIITFAHLFSLNTKAFY